MNGEERELKPHYLLDTNVVVLKLFPGIQENVVATILKIEGLKAVVLGNVRFRQRSPEGMVHPLALPGQCTGNHHCQRDTM